MTRKEKLFAACVCLLALLLWGAMTLLRPGDIGSVQIEIDGQDYGSYALNTDQVIPIGDSNVCEIKDGKVRMTEADCPDQLCIKQGAIGADGGIIVCLPNKVVIRGTGGTAGVDSVS